MPFIFTKRFYILLLAGLIPLAFSWTFPFLKYVVLIYDILLISIAVFDYFFSRRLPDELHIERTFDRRFAIGSPTKVTVKVENQSKRDLYVKLKDEYPAELEIVGSRETDAWLDARSSVGFDYDLVSHKRGLYSFGKTAVRFYSRLGLVWCQTYLGKDESIKVYSNMRRAREMELQALGERSYLAVQRRAVRRGEGREFESMRDYVIGDELRHISWTTTARRNRLTTRQYQIERDQTVIIALDAGRLMTGRINNETKFDTAIHAALALMSACAKAGDNCGLTVFARQIKRYLPPKRGLEHMDATLEALYDIEPELIEPSYSRAFQFIASNLKKRTLVVILTDLVDHESSKDLIRSLKLLRPRHLPLVVTIGDRDLNSTLSTEPEFLRDVYTQSAAAEIVHERESALRIVESMGGLAIDVTVGNLAPALLQSYMRVKERGLL